MGGALERLPFISSRRALFKIQSEAGSEWQPYFCLSSFTQDCGPRGLFQAHLLREITLVMAQNRRRVENFPAFCHCVNFQGAGKSTALTSSQRVQSKTQSDCLRLNHFPRFSLHKLLHANRFLVCLLFF